MALLRVTFLVVFGCAAAVLAQNEFAPLRLPTEEIARQLNAAKVRRVTVVDFTDLNGNALELGRAIAEEIASTLVTIGKPLETIDRSSLAALMREHKLNSSGLIDPTTTREFGRISGVDVIVTGTITLLDSTIRIKLKGIDVKTATMVASADATLVKTPALDRLLRIEVGTSPGSSMGGSGAYQGAQQVQTTGNLSVRLNAVHVLQDGKIRLDIAMRNIRPDVGGIAVALKAEGAGGIADFWKFMPQATASVLDSQGRRYGCPDVTGLGFARDHGDWNVLRGNEEISATLTCNGSSRSRPVAPLTVVIEFWYGEKSGGTASTRSVRFSGVRPK
jgi:TolB-like protein